MTTKVNGAAYPGVWFERKVTFMKLTFSKDIQALLTADLKVLGTSTASGAGTVADSTFGVVESAIVQALKQLETKATVLGVSTYEPNEHSVDVILGNAAGWFSDDVGVIATGLPVVGAQAVVTTAGAAPTNVLGALVSVSPSTVTFSMEFATMDGAMSVATVTNGALVSGPGATPGSDPYGSPTGTAGYYPVSI